MSEHKGRSISCQGSEWKTVTEKKTNGQQADYRDRVIKLCRNHVMTKKRFEDEQIRLSSFCEHMGDDISEFEAVLIQDSIKTIKEAMAHDREELIVFERLLLSLDETEKSIITQLYLDGQRWADVRGIDGSIMCSSSLSAIRKRALTKMASELRYIDALRAKKG